MKRIEDEFAIETATEQYVTRRQFSKFLVLTSLGMFAGNLWILVKSWFRRPTVYTARIVAGMNEIGVGEVKLFYISRTCRRLHHDPYGCRSRLSPIARSARICPAPFTTRRWRTDWNVRATKGTSR